MPESAPAGPVPVLLLSVDVRTETWRSITPIDVTDGAVDWAAIAAAAFMAWAGALDACRRRGLPAPKIRAAAWRGGALLPALDGHEVPAVP